MLKIQVKGICIGLLMSTSLSSCANTKQNMHSNRRNQPNILSKTKQICRQHPAEMFFAALTGTTSLIGANGIILSGGSNNSLLSNTIDQPSNSSFPTILSNFSIPAGLNGSKSAEATTLAYRAYQPKVDESTKFSTNTSTLQTQKLVLEKSDSSQIPQGNVPSVRNNSNPLDQQDIKGMTPLMHAVSIDEIDVVKSLIKQGANLEIKDNTGKTALMHAAIDSKLDILQLLIKSGANKEAKDNENYTALLYTIIYYKPDVAQVLIESKADLSVKDKDGVPILILAVQDNQIDILLFLIDNGADLSVQDKDGCTALMWAVKENKLELAKLLLEKKADINAKDNHGQTALMWAAKESKPEFAKLLIKSAGF